MPTIKCLALQTAALLLAGCTSQTRDVSVCEVRASTDDFIDVDVNLAGFAQVHRHGTNLTDPSCPGIAIALVSPPDDQEGSASDTFFLSLAPGMLRGTPAVPVNVRGKLSLQLDQLPRYIFIVESGRVGATGGG